MKAKQVGLTEYNDIILSVYDANPIVNVSKAVTKNAPEPKATTKKVTPKTGTLVKQTLRLRNTAVLNLKLAKNIFKYEKERLNSLKPYLDGGDKTSEGGSEKSEELKEDSKKEKKKSSWLKGLTRPLRALIKKLFKKLVPKRLRARGRLLRKRVNKFKRRVKVNIKKQWRKFTRPFRQLRRFTQPFRRNVSTRFRRFTRNLTRPFRQGKRFAQTLVRDPRRALQQTQRAFGQAKQYATAGMSAARQFAGNKVNQARKFAVNGYNEVRSGVNFARDMLGRAGFRGPKLPSLGGGGGGGFFGRFTGMGEKLKQGKTAFLGGLESVTNSATVSRWRNVLTDPKTYAAIKNGAATTWNNVKGATKKLYDDFFAWLAGTKQFRNLIESKIGKKITEKLIKKGGKKVLIKILGRLVVGLATVLALWDMVTRWTAGDYEGAAIAAMSAIPVFGLVAVVVDILRDLFPKSWESMVSQITGKDKEQRNVDIKSGFDKAFTPMENAGGNDIGGVPMAADGMVTGDKPQLVIVGDGGEEEYIVPKSKLAYFLGSDTALDFLNFGGSQLLSTVKDYINKAGLRSQVSSIKEFSLTGDLPDVNTNNVEGITRLSINPGTIVERILDFLREGFEGVLEPIKKIFEWIKKNVLDNPLVKLGRGALDAFGNVLVPGANAAGLDQNLFLSDPYSGPISGDTFMPLASSSALAGEQSGQEYGNTSARGGRKHLGIDIVESTLGDSRAPIVAFKTGKVTYAKASNVYPYGEVMVDHGNGLATRYLHITPASNVRVGKQVYGGQQLGTLYRYYGSGGGEQTHLHFEVYQDGKIVDPTSYVRNAKNKLNAPLSAERAKAQHTASSTPVTPINRDTAIGEDPSDMDSIIFAQILQRQIQSQRNTSTPQILPIPIGSGSSMNRAPSNTPAWGHSGLIGN